ncbi:hypothetical protein [Capnocytophaga sp.]|uniref:hypothetical protein n=1 Tax=Capnocytophaga sp. TaxID=44737 RepID=UPI0026DBCFBB|nr:hypothetical protein [Capnocytophaga sp.]MDO5105082.1 hypothetical protein [Capnocytophaga sp.]
MKKYIFILMIFVVSACNQKVTQQDLQHLNGYWEIEKAITPDKQVKEYQLNTTYDYIEINGEKGFRKKVYPQLMGRFQTNDDSETFEVINEANSFKMNYENEGNQWTETLKSINETSFVVENEAGIEYHYKRVKN